MAWVICEGDGVTREGDCVYMGWAMGASAIVGCGQPAATVRGGAWCAQARRRAERMSRPQPRQVGLAVRTCSCVTGQAGGDHASNRNRRRNLQLADCTGGRGMCTRSLLAVHHAARALSRTAGAHPSHPRHRSRTPPQPARRLCP